jgi:hypothetical protein
VVKRTNVSLVACEIAIGRFKVQTAKIKLVHSRLDYSYRNASSLLFLFMVICA